LAYTAICLGITTMTSNLNSTLTLISLLTANPLPKEYEAALVVWQVLLAAGYAVSDPTKGERGTPIDLRFSGTLNGVEEKVGVEIKAHGGHVSSQTIYKALDARKAAGLDRMLVIALGEFSPLARERTASERLGKLDLLTPNDLRDWVLRYAQFTAAPVRAVNAIMRDAMRETALRLAARPGELSDLSWLDLERMMREVFEGLGFDTELTRSTKDGGFDLRLAVGEDVYLIEVKHWKDKKVGASVATGLQVVATQHGAKGGLVLASGGFTPTVFEGLLRAGPPVHLGDGKKIIGLCQAFYRQGAPIWQQDTYLPALLLKDTAAPWLS
jgi:hypothetical protein